MSNGAFAFMVFSLVASWGGFAFFLVVAMTKKAK